MHRAEPIPLCRAGVYSRRLIGINLSSRREQAPALRDYPHYNTNRQRKQVLCRNLCVTDRRGRVAVGRRSLQIVIFLMRRSLKPTFLSLYNLHLESLGFAYGVTDDKGEQHKYKVKIDTKVTQGDYSVDERIDIREKSHTDG